MNQTDIDKKICITMAPALKGQNRKAQGNALG